ncbi:hypothetical protein EDD15DRAFT_2199084 [Pisolithus albus]|nr:hypothetical protein EDD15DRAFT_2199084 [Pisolithus albus]
MHHNTRNRPRRLGKEVVSSKLKGESNGKVLSPWRLPGKGNANHGKPQPQQMEAHLRKMRIQTMSTRVLPPAPLFPVSSHVTDEDGQNATNEEDQLASTGKTDKMKPTCNPQKRSSTTAIQLFALTIWPSLASMATSFLDDTSKYLDSDGFEVFLSQMPVPQNLVPQVPRSEAQNITVQPESQRGIVDSSTSTSGPRKPAQKREQVQGQAMTKVSLQQKVL